MGKGASHFTAPADTALRSWTSHKTSTAVAEPPASAAAKRPFSTKVIHSGHSLTDPIVSILDVMVSAMGQQDARAQDIARSIIPGSPMEWRWEQRTEYGHDVRYDIADYELLVITERVYLSNTVEWHNL